MSASQVSRTLGVVLILVSPVPVAGSAQAASAVSGTAVNQANGLCMDVPNGASTSALQLVQWSCNGGTNQTFTFNPVAGTTDTYTIGDVTAGDCLDISGRSTADN